MMNTLDKKYSGQDGKQRIKLGFVENLVFVGDDPSIMFWAYLELQKSDLRIL